ncbi:hypothetical protein J4727_11245 [Providencia rettgeri]|uniref:Uncharacterized protein n=1 Tax=Providencia rettgeri TaxID=587 RepID=A0A939SQU1_PRORE|nr:hypothetical protein [Providencia rettgeri]
MRVYKNIQLAVGASLLMSLNLHIIACRCTNQSANLWDTFKSNVSTTWDSDKYELYVPAVTWHNRCNVRQEKQMNITRRPWGLGFVNIVMMKTMTGMLSMQWHLKIHIMIGSQLVVMHSKNVDPRGH